MPRDAAAGTRGGDANLRAQEERTAAGPDRSAARTTYLTNWGPTFDMSGGPKGAKRPLGRPLDGGVRRHFAYLGHLCAADTEFDSIGVAKLGDSLPMQVYGRRDGYSALRRSL